MARASCGCGSRMERRDVRVSAAAAWKPPETTQSALADAYRMLFCGNDGREHAMSRTQGGALESVDGSSARQAAERSTGGSKLRHEWASVPITNTTNIQVAYATHLLSSVQAISTLFSMSLSTYTPCAPLPNHNHCYTTHCAAAAVCCCIWHHFHHCCAATICEPSSAPSIVASFYSAKAPYCSRVLGALHSASLFTCFDKYSCPFPS
jgi:hypothetical protein